MIKCTIYVKHQVEYHILTRLDYDGDSEYSRINTANCKKKHASQLSGWELGRSGNSREV